MRGTPEERFWAKVEKSEGDGCWTWQGTRDAAGYGAFRPVYGENMVKAHRFAYTEVRGPIPPGLELDHLCRTRNCVRVDHLEAVTHAENVRRKSEDICPFGHPRGTYGGQRCCPTCRRKQLNEWQNANRARKRGEREQNQPV